MNAVGRKMLLLSCIIGASACTADRAPESRASSRGALSGASADGSTARLLPWSERGAGVGLRPAVPERAAFGAPAIAVGPGGQVFVLDAVNARVVRVDRGEAIPVAEVPKDADDLAIGPDGAIAVRRSVRPEVLVFDPDGTPAGRLDTSAVESAESITLGLSRRVIVTTPFQETFALGSPSFPQLAAAVHVGKREGAAFLEGGAGVAAVRRDDGELELRVSSPRGSTRLALGRGDAARVVGASGSIACARVEHVSQRSASGAEDAPIEVEREVACLDVATGRSALRVRLPAPGTYVPRRELAFAGTTLAFAHPTDDGLSITTWTVEAGAR